MTLFIYIKQIILTNLFYNCISVLTFKENLYSPVKCNVPLNGLIIRFIV